MTAEHPPDSPIRVLVADDEAPIRDAYRQILASRQDASRAEKFERLRSRLYTRTATGDPAAAKGADRRQAVVDLVLCEGAEAAVAAVRDALAAAAPIAIAFLDMRMPPGPDGAWAAARIRELDPAIEIVICTAYSDEDATAVAGLVPPEEKLSFLQKPFHSNEIRQMTLTLASKWRSERRINTLAHFDPLTGLPNREQFRTHLASAIEAARAQASAVALLHLDIDNFKRVNDTLGHPVGDELLCVAARRLENARQGAVGRLGGDEFVVALTDTGAANARRVAETLIDILKAPVQLGAHKLVVTSSVGIARFPEDGESADTLLRHADLAMEDAKRSAVGGCRFFGTAMNESASRRFAIESQLHGALERGEFSVHYQPLFDVTTTKISGMEALLRWTNAELGAVSPVEFIPVAEDTGLILSIGEWVLRQACQQARDWHEEGLPFSRIAVNVSGKQFARGDFPDIVRRIIAEVGIDGSLLELEITESVVMQDEVGSQKIFAELRQLGASLAIDDFGTGYSSFGRLRNFSVDRLKIDRSFVTSLVECNDDRTIAAAIIAMSRSLRIHVTAEGVESFPQLAFLQEQNCQEAQGFLFSRPLPPAEAVELLRRAARAADSSPGDYVRAIVS